MSPWLEQTSVLKLQLLYACDCGFMVPVLTMYFAVPIWFFFNCFMHVPLGVKIC